MFHHVKKTDVRSRRADRSMGLVMSFIPAWMRANEPISRSITPIVQMVKCAIQTLELCLIGPSASPEKACKRLDLRGLLLI